MPRKKKISGKITESSPSEMFYDKGYGVTPVRSPAGSWNVERNSNIRRRSEQNVSLSPGNVIRNQFFSGDGTDPVESLHSLQEIFKGKLGRDVVQLVFSECSYNVEQALESLFELMPETEIKPRCTTKDWSSQPTTSTDLGPQSPAHIMALRGGGNNNVGYKRVHTYAETKKSSWNTINVSSDSSSDCASMKDYDPSDPNVNRGKAGHQHFADVIYHKSELDGSVKGSNLSVNTVRRIPPSNNSPKLSATGFTFSINPDSKSVDSIFSSKNAIEETIMLIQSKERVLIILRGLPGSGKSTLAQKLNINGAIFSTDDYFLNENNEYKFEPTMLTEAHESNKARTLSALEEYITPIIIDNTNIEACHIKPYVMLGIKFKYKIIILEPNTLWKFNVSELTRRNHHGVSKKSISRMLERYEHGITVENFGLGYTKSNNFSQYLSNVSFSERANSDVLQENSRNSTPERNLASTEKFSGKKSIQITDTPNKGKIYESSSKTSLSSDNVDNSSNSSQTSDGLKSINSQCLELADFMALAQQESEDSLSISRRTSASSSQDTSGWEHDEEFLWSSDDNRLHNHSPFNRPEHLTNGIFEHGDRAKSNEDIYTKAVHPSKYGHSDTSLNVPGRQNAGGEGLSDSSSDKPSGSITSSDWSIPSYPMSKQQQQSYQSKGYLSISVPIPVHASCQTSSKDFYELQSVNSLSQSQTLAATLKVLVGHSNISICVFTNINAPKGQVVPISPVFDKSTTTEDLDDTSIDKGNKVKLLKSMFPSIADPDLEDILDKCHGDHDWAVNLLIDFGLEFNNLDCKVDPHLEEKKQPEKLVSEKCPVEVVTSSNGKLENNVSSKIEISPPPEMKNHVPDVAYDRVVLTLEPAFVLQLEEMFGTVGFNMSLGGLSSEDFQVPLSRDLALQIYNMWKRTLQQKCTPPQPPSSNAGGRKFLSGPSGEVPALADIMAMEAALEAKRLEMLKSPNNNADALATKLGRLKLYDMFPGIDQAALDEMYEANNYKLSLTLLSLHETLGEGSNGGPWLSPDMVDQTEEELCRMASEASLEGLLEVDWRSWVADIPAGEDVLPPEDYQAVPGFEDIRAEATLHYRKKRECYQKSSDAYQRGMKAVASYYSQQGHLHAKKLKEANQRAAEKILEIRNTSVDPSSLDLHGLYVAEAVVALQHFLEKKKEEFKKSSLNRLVLSVITGRGAHSNKQVPRIRPACQEFLNKESYKYEVIQDGVLKVTLT